VEACYNQELGKDITVASLEAEYDAVYLAMGAWDNQALGVPGEDLDGVWKGTEFLQKRELGIKVDLTGKKVIVVGGGNTAMDACRSSLRMGAKEVVLLYRRTRKEMPANAVEIEAAEHEGVKYHFLAAPTKLIGEGGKLKQIEYIKMELGEPDKSGRRRPVPIKGSETVMDADVVIAAIGQVPRIEWAGDDLVRRGLKITKWKTIEANEVTLQTGLPKVFTGGDIFSGPALLVDAIGAGRRAARSIHLFLKGEDISMPEGVFYKPTRIALSKEIPVQGVTKRKKVPQPELNPAERIKSFDEVDLTLTPGLMEAEAARCLRCGTICYWRDEDYTKHLLKQAGAKRGAMEVLEQILRESP
jgi:NADPH-dependent glutamate synthase beta subunit-like oxidoreductase